MDLTQLLDWITNIGRLFLLGAVGIWAIRYSRLPRAVRVFGLYLLLNLLLQTAAYLLWRQKMNNLPLLHLNTLLEFVFISWFFKEVYTGLPVFKGYFLPLIGGLTLLLILNSVFVESVFDFNTRAKTFVQMVLMLYVVLYFFDAYGRVDLMDREQQAISFLCFAVLFYYAGSLFIFMFSEFSKLEQVQEGYKYIWLINAFLTAIFQLIALVAISRAAFPGKKPAA